jgi:hypothetical protein
LTNLETWPVSLTIGNFLRRCPKRHNTAAFCDGLRSQISS